MFVWLYNIVASILKLGAYLYFSDIVVIGKKNVPRTGPAIIIANHPNDMLDPVLIGTTCGRMVGVWGKASLFKGPAGVLLRAVGCVPVNRKQDATDAASQQAVRMDNSKLEEESFTAFKEGRVIALFPEGTSHSEAHLLALKDGVSWTKFDILDKTDGKMDIPIIPCGITYITKHKWRSQVVVHYGAPVYGTERLAEYREDPKKAVKKFTGELQKIMYSLTVNAPDWETMKVIQMARRIYMGNTKYDVAEYVEILRRFAVFHETLKDTPAVKDLTKEIQSYTDKLHHLHLRDAHVRSDLPIRKVIRGVFDRIFFLTVLGPLSLPGFLINAPIMILSKYANTRTPYQESKATHTLITSMVIAPIVYNCAAFLMWYFLGLTYPFAFLVLCLMGIAHVRLLEEEVMGWKSVISSLRFLFVIAQNKQRQELKELKKTRQELEVKITGIVNTHASPEYRTLDNLREEGSEEKGFTKRIIPPLIRSNSFTDIYL